MPSVWKFASIERCSLDLLRQRSLAARYEKARRGELIVAAPIGYVTTDQRLEKDPDRRVQEFQMAMLMPDLVLAVALEFERHDCASLSACAATMLMPRVPNTIVSRLEKSGQAGSTTWGVFEDAADVGRMVETFLVEFWLEHLRQHERVTNADRVLQETVHRFQIEGTPKITHLIAAEPGPAVAEARPT